MRERMRMEIMIMKTNRVMSSPDYKRITLGFCPELDTYTGVV